MKIFTGEDFSEFDGFKSTGQRDGLNIIFDDGTSLSCSNNHAIKLYDDTWALARELIVGDQFGYKKIMSIQSIGFIETYSPINVLDKFSYYSDGIIHHNCAFVENWDQFFSSVYPTISSGDTTKMLLTSTPNGLNHFYKTCEGAREGTNGYEFVEVPWHRVPGRGEKWKQETLAAMDFDYERFEQEFNCGFQGSSGTLISGATLKTLVAKKPLSSKDGLTQYYLPEPEHRYVITADVSRGKGLDYSAYQVIDVTSMPYQQVCTYRSNLITPNDYASVIHYISKTYNDATILVEINDIGGQVADTLYNDFESDSLICTENGGARGRRISSGFSKTSERGVRTTKSVKSVGCSILKLLVEQHQLIINDHQTIFELSRFSRKGTSYEAEPGCNDDLVMCLVLFAWMSDQQYFRELTDINTLMKLREKTDDDIENDVIPFGYMVDGREDYNQEFDYQKSEFDGLFF